VLVEAQYHCGVLGSEAVDPFVFNLSSKCRFPPEMRVEAFSRYLLLSSTCI
jgi:hypothetical protein